NFFVEHALVEHFEQADGTDLHDAAREAGRVNQHQHIEGIAIVRERGGDETVVARVVDGRVEVAVKAEDVELLVVLVFVDALGRNLDDDVKDLGCFFADGQFQVINHG